MREEYQDHKIGLHDTQQLDPGDIQMVNFIYTEKKKKKI